MPLTPPLITAAVFAATVMIVLATGGVVALAQAGRAKRRRLARAAGGSQAATVVAAVAESGTRTVRRALPGRYQRLERALLRLPGAPHVQALLMQTGAAIPLSRFLAICVLITIAAAGAGIFVLGAPALMAVALAVLTGWGLPRVLVGYLAARRVQAFIVELPDALEVIVRGLKAGLPISEMIGNVARDFEGPVGREFQHVADTMRLGNTLEDALWEVAGRIDVSEFTFLAVSVGLQRETGGNLTETLQNLADLLRKRQQMRQKVKALTSEARASAYIIGSLPFIIGALIYTINPAYMSTLFTDPAGPYLLAAALTSETLGIVVIIRLMRFEI